MLVDFEKSSGMSVRKLIILTLTSLLVQLVRASDEPPILDSQCAEYEDAFNPTQLPYPNDCTKFYKCSGGFAFPMSCPRGLHWSVPTNRCEYPSVAGCDKSIKVPTRAPSSGTARDNNNGIAATDCPIGENPNNPTQLAYPGDCTRFYKCLDGMAYPINCPAGLHWSTTLNRCDWPSVAQCIGSTIPLKPTTAKPNSVNCPAVDDSNNPTRLPYPGDCKSFYFCTQGTAVRVVCPNALHWSVTLNNCVSPSVAGCTWGEVSDPVTKPIAPTAAPSTAPAATPTRAPAATPTTAPTATPSAIDPAIPSTPLPPLSDLDAYCKSKGTQSGYVSYPGDCKRFIQCANGRGYIQTCPGSLLFNSKLLACARYCV